MENISNTIIKPNKLLNKVELDNQRCFKMVTCDKYGRHYIATRNIDPGEALLIERPAVVAPLHPSSKNKALCLNCSKSCQEYSCPCCGFFFCDENCITEEHSAECIVLKTIGIAERCATLELHLSQRIIPKDISTEEQEDFNIILNQARTSSLHRQKQEAVKFYPILPTLRTLLKMDKDPDFSKRVLSLQAHIDESCFQYRMNQKRIVQPIHNITNGKYDDSLTLKVAAIWDTNSFDISLLRQNFQGLFIETSFFTHSCLPNCEVWLLDDNSIVIRCIKDIKENDVLTISYADLLWPTRLRIDHLKLTKHFICQCLRCEDPDEGESYLGSLKCDNCDDFLYRKNSNYNCQQCQFSFPLNKLNQLDFEAAKHYQNAIDGQTLSETKEASFNLSNMIHQNYYLLVKAKVDLLKQYRDLTGMTLEDLTQRVKQLEFIYDVISKIYPISSRQRAIVGSQLVRASMKKQKMIGCQNSNKALETIKSQVYTVLGWEPKLLNRYMTE